MQHNTLRIVIATFLMAFVLPASAQNIKHPKISLRGYLGIGGATFQLQNVNASNLSLDQGELAINSVSSETRSGFIGGTTLHFSGGRPLSILIGAGMRSEEVRLQYTGIRNVSDELQHQLTGDVALSAIHLQLPMAAEYRLGHDRKIGVSAGVYGNLLISEIRSGIESSNIYEPSTGLSYGQYIERDEDMWIPRRDFTLEPFLRVDGKVTGTKKAGVHIFAEISSAFRGFENDRYRSSQQFFRAGVALRTGFGSKNCPTCPTFND